jgi:type IV pilus assembly protein PilA
MKRLQQGFTLIELMIVVAIVGILAAIALPAYQDYVIRSKMSEGVAASAACKTSISEYVSTKNAWPTDSDSAGCSTLATQYVSGLTVGTGGVITVTTTNTGSKSGGSASDCVLVLTAQFTALPDITGWSGSHSGCDAKYVPSNFR